MASQDLSKKRVDEWLDGWNNVYLSREDLTHLASHDEDFIIFLDLCSDSETKECIGE